jgi:predicted ATPase/class 3 adenylate cyclase
MATPRADRLLPTGTVTFLFTDVEGSTRLWETQHAAMQQALADHDAILREAIEANQGCLVKTTGDGAHAAFAIAADAIAACVAAQRALEAHAWGELSIKSRMALHSGEAEQRDGDCYGPALNLAARLTAAAHGGQILLSLSTEELLRGHLPADIALRDMGERRLKDLVRPERVFQVIAPDLPADFPPLKTLDARPNNLPAQTTQFIGREKAIRAVREHLSDAKVRLLTLSGVGGTGKTRLALQVAADVVDEFEHGVFFVPLAALSDPALVLPTIAQTFDVREAAGRPLQEQLQDYLREKQMLLVLDNFEQVIDAASRVTDLLTVARRLKVLVTSREVLRLSGETDYPVPSLSLPDPQRLPPLERFTQYEAVALFIERAAAVKPAFAVTNENAPAIAQICHRLDGLPLAIELAAARVRVLPPQRMLVELSHRLSFLMGGARDLPARQKTLRGAIDWSYDLLTGDEQKLFRRLAVFVGGCTLEAIEAVCNIETDMPVLETVESLVGKSLMKQTEAQGEPRFTMLETIREYASERLIAAGETERLRDRHRDYFLALAEGAEPKLIGAEQATWFQRLEEEHDNLRSALEWSLVEAQSTGGLRLCGALVRFWVTRGHLSEGREWCVRFLGKGGRQARTLERAKALIAAGALAYFQGDYLVTQALQEESLAIMRGLGDRSGIARALTNLGAVAVERGNFASARALLEESTAIFRELGDRDGIAHSLNNLGNVARDLGDFASARARYEESLAIWRELGNRRGVARSLNSLGNLALYQGDYPAARTLHEESLAIRWELGDRRGMALALNNLGLVANVQGDTLTARRLSEKSLAIRRELGDRRGVAHSLNNLGDVDYYQSDYPAARARHEESLAIRRELGDRSGIAHSLNNLGNVVYVQGDYSAAWALYEESLAISAELGERRAIAYSLEGLAGVASALGSSLRAASIWGAAERLREDIGSPLRPNERPCYDRRVAGARTALKDDAAFDRAWQAGRAFTREEAIELALEEAVDRP